MKKTNAMRILEAKRVEYTTLSYEVDSEHLDAVHTAELLAIDPDSLFKTIVMQSVSNMIFVFCVPASTEVSLKKAKAIVGEKVSPLKLSELQKTTGYVRGGCSPIGMKKPFPVFIDESACMYDEVYVNAGERGALLCVAPASLKDVCGADFVDISE